jgi:hypothetical protein
MKTEKKETAKTFIKGKTEAQLKALSQSLERQKSPKTPMEKEVMMLLRDMFSEKLTGKAKGYKRFGNYVKMIDMDTFGEDYRNNWIKIQESDKGEFFVHQYTGGKRVYI